PILTLLLDTNKIISIIAAVTPYLIAVILIIVAYSIFTMDISLTTADAIAKEQTSASSNWLLSAFLYVSYNISAGAALLIIMAGQVKDKKVWHWRHYRWRNFRSLNLINSHGYVSKN